MTSTYARPFIYISIFLLPLFFCKSPEVKDKKNDKDSLAKIHEEAEKGREKGYQDYATAIDNAKKNNDPELQQTILKDLATIPSEKSREILKSQAVSESGDVRDVALKGFYDQSKSSRNPEMTETTKEAIKDETVDIIKGHAEKYNDLTPKEIQILGEINNEESRDILNDMVKSTAPDFTKEAVINELYNAYGSDSRTKLLKMYEDPGYDENVKVMILKTLARRDHYNNDPILQSLKAEYLKTDDAAEHERLLARISALDLVDTKALKAQLDRQREKIRLRNQLLELSKKGQLVMLKTLFQKYEVSEKVLDAMQTSTQELAADNTTPMRAEAVILFSSLRQIYPDKNYFELKKSAPPGLQVPGLFYTILQSIDNNYESYDMKIFTIRSVFKIDQTDAANIYKAFQGEKDTLKELLR